VVYTKLGVWMASCPATRSAAARSAATDTLAAVANHGTIIHQSKAAVSGVVQRRDSAFADHRAYENDRVPQTPLWELADASTLFSAVAALRPGRASVFHDRSEPPRSCPHLPASGSPNSRVTRGNLD
jgi:hypothetical protein